ncbi:MAG: bacillithiol biosynthesis deacetylase BshB1 [Chitinophagales bacterium]
MQLLDILAFGAHPDDVEFSCAGTIVSHVHQGKKVGVIDLTRGELGTRGTPAQRYKEANHAAEIMGLTIRENLGFADGFFTNDSMHKIAVIKKIRKYRPQIILAPAIYDRHPDHGRSADLIADACFLSGLRKIETLDEKGNLQEAWRPKVVYHYLQDTYIAPTFVVDISDYMDKKIEATKAYVSQVHNEQYKINSDEVETYISNPDYIERIIARNREVGKQAGCQFAEGFTVKRIVGVKNLFDLM